MNPTRRALLGGLGALAGAAWLRPPAARGASDDAPHLIVVTAFGGWDVSYFLDPKPGSPDVDGPELDEDPEVPDDVEAITTFGAIPVGTNRVKRPSVNAYFEAWGPRTTVVNGLWIGSFAHQDCAARLLTGTAGATAPDVAAITADALGRDALIPYMDLGGGGFPGELAALTGRTGVTGQLRFLLDRRFALPAPPGAGFTYPQYLPRPADQDAIGAWLADRGERWSAARGGRGQGASRVDDWFDARDRAERMRGDGQSLAGLLPGGVQLDLGTQSDVAVQLLTSGIAHTVLLDSGLPWDTHTNAADQHVLLEFFFARLHALVDQLSAASLLDRTLVVVVSEMTRTPKRNDTGGKDHWPVTSAMVVGGPTAGGRVLGATDGRLDALPVDLATGQPDEAGELMRYDHFAAAILETLDVDWSRWHPRLDRPLGGLRA